MERPKILIVSGYHPNETFAVKIGEYLFQNNLNSDVKIARYTGKRDRKGSTYNLRRFIEGFDPVISPLVLHDDDDLEIEAVIIYCAKSKGERRKALKPLVDFTSRYSGRIACGRFLTFNTKCDLIEIELNSRLGLQKAVDLIENFSKYLVNLYFSKGIKL